MNFQLLRKRFTKLFFVLQSPRLIKVFFNNGVLISLEHRNILQKQYKTVIDIVANKGQFSLAVRYWIPEAQIIAFEPLRGAVETYRRIFQDDKKVILHQVAVGPGEVESIIHISKADDSSSLLPISQLQTKLFPGTEEIRTEPVEVKRLSELISPEDLIAPILLKLDVQGFELDVLKGCKDLFYLIEDIIVECSFMELYKGQALVFEVVRYLDSIGYIFQNIYNLESDHNGNAIQGDFVFQKNL